MDDIKLKFLAEFLNVDESEISIDISPDREMGQELYIYIDKEKEEKQLWEVFYTGLSTRAVCKKIYRILPKGQLREKQFVKLSIDIPASIFTQLQIARKKKKGCTLQSMVVKLLTYALDFQKQEEKK